MRREQRVKLLEEAEVAIGHMEYARAMELLTSVAWDCADLQELAVQATSLLEEAERRARELEDSQVELRVPARRPKPHLTPRPAPSQRPDKKSRLALGTTLAVVALALASLGTWYLKGRNVPGFVEITAAPWAELTSISTVKGQRLNITGETPLQVALPPGRYVIELKKGQATGRVEVAVERGKVIVVNYIFPEVKIDDLVQKVVSEH